MTTKPHRGTILVEDATVLEQFVWPNEQFIIRLQAPRIAAVAEPGSFVHLTCDADIPMRRPLSILYADRDEGWLDILYKVHGAGLAALARQTVGTVLSCLGPIGQPFRAAPERPNRVMIGGGVGIPPVVFFAAALAADKTDSGSTVAFLGSELPFPFEMGRAKTSLAGIDETVNATMAFLDECGVPSRLASLAGFDAVYNGYVTELARQYLNTLSDTELAQTELFACGPTPMLKATAALARDVGVACKVSLEEYMACAVGGCAGCTVPVHSDGKVTMKRVCVDGPVFDAESVFPASP
ncbi:MAG: dihydroorotate dehydrogenase electron transfer subunit [Pseudomonadota bacterium]